MKHIIAGGVHPQASRFSWFTSFCGEWCFSGQNSHWKCKDSPLERISVHFGKKQCTYLTCLMSATCFVSTLTQGPTSHSYRVFVPPEEVHSSIQEVRYFLGPALRNCLPLLASKTWPIWILSSYKLTRFEIFLAYCINCCLFYTSPSPRD